MNQRKTKQTKHNHVGPILKHTFSFSTLLLAVVIIDIVMANEGADPNATHEPNYRYDVFLSFGSVDTGGNFPQHLYHALRLKGLNVFLDEVDISLAVFKAIKESRISIVFFARNYAYSTWRLDELVKILECMKLKNQRVCPIFYNVEPSDVRHQRNSYGKAMAKHERRFGKDSKKVLKWRSALFEVTSLSGWHFRNDRNLSADEFVQKIGDWVTQSLFDYDVFLSFREDTRYSFTGFLYNALRQEGFNTFFMHGEKVFEGGNQISPFHMKAIEESKFSIIVLSKNYAYSSWCLDELVKILECKKLKKQRVFPIFYKVQPSDIRYQTSHYGKAMAAHEITFGKDSQKVQKWRLALSQVANLKGWHFETGYEYKTIQRIVELVSKSLPRYDVFLSFRGRDTRQTFTGYLYNALCKKGLKTFMDDEALEGGEQISQSLINAIEESRLSIIVFSENFAYSSWCLDELVKILECMKMKYHLVWPIFYKVEPLDVMHQKNSYGEAMAAHENRYRDDSEKVQKWRSALYEVANLEEAWHFQTGYEYEVIDSIVEEATMILNRLYIPSPCSSVN